jgi:hypothetical protein
MIGNNISTSVTRAGCTMEHKGIRQNWRARSTIPQAACFLYPTK